MIKREEKDRNESLNKEILAKFVNYALASSKIKNIKIKQEVGEYNLRPNINLFIYGSIGSSKSTLLNQIAEKTKSKAPYTELSFPALIGSVDKMTRQLVIGASWECRNSLLLLDEFNFAKRNKDDIRALLQLIEGGKYNRKLASFSAPQEEIDEDLYYKFENGEFNIKTRFSLILATMKYPYTSQNQELQALISRSITLPFYPSKEVLKKIAQGYSIFNYKDKSPKKENIIINKKDYDYILNYVDKKVEENNFLRIVGDCVRIFAIEEEHKTDIYDLIIKFGNKKFQSKKPI